MVAWRKYVLISILAGFMLPVAFFFVATLRSPAAQAAPAPYVARQSDRLPGGGRSLPGGGQPGQRHFSGSLRGMAPSQGFTPGGQRGDGGKYATEIIIYSAVFFLLAIGAYVFRKKLRISPGRARVLIPVLLCAGLAMRVFLGTAIRGQPFDISFFQQWAVAAAHNLLHFYAGSRSSDYPPLYIYVLYVVGKIASISAMSRFTILLLKMPSILADIATSFLIYRLARRYVSLEAGILLLAFYLFNPAVFVNSSIWGQVDSFLTLIVVSAVYLLAENKVVPAAALFAAAVLMKPQGIIFLPVLFFELVRRKNLKTVLKAAASAVAAAVIIILPFSLEQGPLWIFRLFAGTMGEYAYASVNAFNFFGLLGANYVDDGKILFIFSYHTWGMIFIVLLTLLAGYVIIKGNDGKYLPAAALLLIAGVFTFSTRMHERYLFPAVALAVLAFIYLKDKRLLWLAMGLGLTSYFNTYLVLYHTGMGAQAVPSGPAVLAAAALNVLMVLYLGWVLFDVAVRKKRILPSGRETGTSASV